MCGCLHFLWLSAVRLIIGLAFLALMHWIAGIAHQSGTFELYAVPFFALAAVLWVWRAYFYEQRIFIDDTIDRIAISTAVAIGFIIFTIALLSRLGLIERL